MKEKRNGSVRTTSQRVGGLVTDCPVLGGDEESLRPERQLTGHRQGWWDPEMWARWGFLKEDQKS